MRLVPVERVKKILIVRPDALGDMVLTLPCILAIKRKYPAVHISVLASEYNARIIEHLPYIDDIIYDRPVTNLRDFMAYWRFLRAQRFDVAVHYYSETKLIWLTWAAGIPYQLGDKAKLGLWPVLRKYGYFYKSFDQPKHVVEYNFLLLKPLGIEILPDTKLELLPPERVVDGVKTQLNQLGRRWDKPLIGVQIGVGMGNRPVRPNKYGDYIRQLLDRHDADVCISGYSDAEVEMCHEIESLVQDSRLKKIVRMPIQELMGLISVFDVFVSVDTGPFHIGAALGIPMLAIFPSKKVKAASWAPWRTPHFIVREAHSCPYFCPHRNCPLDICSDHLQAHDMVDKTMALLNGGGVVDPDAQTDYWFCQSFHVLVVGDKSTQTEAEMLKAKLEGWGLRVFLWPNNGTVSLKTFMIAHDISIIHNVGGTQKLKWVWVSQVMSRWLHNPPLVVHGEHSFSSRAEAIRFYCEAFSRKRV